MLAFIAYERVHAVRLIGKQIVQFYSVSGFFKRYAHNQFFVSKFAGSKLIFYTDVEIGMLKFCNAKAFFLASESLLIDSNAKKKALLSETDLKFYNLIYQDIISCMNSY